MRKTTSPFAICSLPCWLFARCSSNNDNRGAGKGSGSVKHNLTPYSFFTRQNGEGELGVSSCTRL